MRRTVSERAVQGRAGERGSGRTLCVDTLEELLNEDERVGRCRGRQGTEGLWGGMEESLFIVVG